jgi:hypothetical protein
MPFVNKKYTLGQFEKSKITQRTQSRHRVLGGHEDS